MSLSNICYRNTKISIRYLKYNNHKQFLLTSLTCRNYCVQNLTRIVLFHNNQKYYKLIGGISQKTVNFCSSMSAPTPTATKPHPTSSTPSPLIEESPVSQEEFSSQEFLENWKWLTEYGPGFPVDGDKVKIIHSPDEFYSQLLEKSKGAEKRVSLASLYLGNGVPEQKLVETLESNGTGNKNLEIKVLLDYTRGSRGSDNSRTMLVPLIKNCSDCNVFLYHTPQLRGLIKQWLPQRWNEIIGLQHMKIYIFDNSVIISGANLSTDYFTNRQDRYFLIEDCKDLADFYDKLIDTVSEFSFQLDDKNNVKLSSNWKTHPSDGDLNTFVSQANDCVSKFYDNYKNSNSSRLVTFYCQSNKNYRAVSKTCENDTWIFPLIQMGALGISNDQNATCRIFEKSPQGSHIKLATGYFNLTSEYINKIISNSSTSYEILMAHPKANGFFGARGFAGGIPAAYTLLPKQFLDNASAARQMYRLAMREYVREKWTYHAKGLWYYPPKSSLPMVTLIGSPNFGHRSVYRDLETQLYVISLNPQLQERLDEERKHLFNNSVPFITSELSQPSRIVPLWVRMVIMLFRNFF